MDFEDFRKEKNVYKNKGQQKLREEKKNYHIENKFSLNGTYNSD